MMLGIGCLVLQRVAVNWCVGALCGSREFRTHFGTRSDTAGDLLTLGKSLVSQAVVAKLAENAEKAPKCAL